MQALRYSSSYFAHKLDEGRLFDKIVRQGNIVSALDYESGLDCKPMYSSFAPDRIFKMEQRTFNGKKIPLNQSVKP